MEQQERALAAYVDSVRDEPTAIAVVVVGSVARGTERPDSDVDVYLVVDDQRFAAETAAGRFAWMERSGLDYPGSYIDVKLVSPAYLEAAALDADDPTRASFLGARIAYARGVFASERLGPLIAGISVLPDHVWAERITSFLAQVRLYGGYFLRQAVERDDPFLRRHAGIHLAFAAARAALAADHTLLRGPKYVSELLGAVPTPVGFMDAWQHVVDDPDIHNAAVLMGLLDEWFGYDDDPDVSLSVFIRDNELAWLRGTIPTEFW